MSFFAQSQAYLALLLSRYLLLELTARNDSSHQFTNRQLTAWIKPSFSTLERELDEGIIPIIDEQSRSLFSATNCFLDQLKAVSFPIEDSVFFEKITTPVRLIALFPEASVEQKIGNITNLTGFLTDSVVTCEHSQYDSKGEPCNPLLWRVTITSSEDKNLYTEVKYHIEESAECMDKKIFDSRFQLYGKSPYASGALVLHSFSDPIVGGLIKLIEQYRASCAISEFELINLSPTAQFQHHLRMENSFGIECLFQNSHAAKKIIAELSLTTPAGLRGLFNLILAPKLVDTINANLDYLKIARERLTEQQQARYHALLNLTQNIDIGFANITFFRTVLALAHAVDPHVMLFNCDFTMERMVGHEEGRYKPTFEREKLGKKSLRSAPGWMLFLGHPNYRFNSGLSQVATMTMNATLLAAVALGVALTITHTLSTALIAAVIGYGIYLLAAGLLKLMKTTPEISLTS